MPRHGRSDHTLDALDDVLGLETGRLRSLAAAARRTAGSRGIDHAGATAEVELLTAFSLVEFAGDPCHPFHNQVSVWRAVAVGARRAWLDVRVPTRSAPSVHVASMCSVDALTFDASSGRLAGELVFARPLAMGECLRTVVEFHNPDSDRPWCEAITGPLDVSRHSLLVVDFGLTVPAEIRAIALDGASGAATSSVVVQAAHGQVESIGLGRHAHGFRWSW